MTDNKRNSSRETEKLKKPKSESAEDKKRADKPGNEDKPTVAADGETPIVAP